jgi:hypothetical protein
MDANIKLLRLTDNDFERSKKSAWLIHDCKCTRINYIEVHISGLLIIIAHYLFNGKMRYAGYVEGRTSIQAIENTVPDLFRSLESEINFFNQQKSYSYVNN